LSLLAFLFPLLLLAAEPEPSAGKALAAALMKHPDQKYLSDCMGRAVFLARGGRKADARASLEAVRHRFVSVKHSKEDKAALFDQLEMIEGSINSFDFLPDSERKKTAAEDAKLIPCLPSDTAPTQKSKK
jgi:hypothetical protein